MSPTDARISADQLAELEGLSRAILTAARAEDVERLTGLLMSRRQLLERCRSRALGREEFRRLSRLDTETRHSVEAQLQRMQGDLAALQVGGRALRQYETRVPRSPGFIDQSR